MSFKNKESKELSDLFQELKIENGVLQGIYKITVLFYVGTALTIVLPMRKSEMAFKIDDPHF